MSPVTYNIISKLWVLNAPYDVTSAYSYDVGSSHKPALPSNHVAYIFTTLNNLLIFKHNLFIQAHVALITMFSLPGEYIEDTK